jgi:3'5'-cyclic nucleotide phosphodiesterase
VLTKLSENWTTRSSNTINKLDPLIYLPPHGTTCLDEYKESIEIRKNTDMNMSTTMDHETVPVELNELVVLELRLYISILAKSYRANSFHNFDHACHVSMSVHKLLQRIVASDCGAVSVLERSGEGDVDLHDCTYGIASDPLAQLAIMFSAIIHDVDHRGCSNVCLVQEEEVLAKRYRNKSIAEQNSIDIAWGLLMDDQFRTLRGEMFSCQKELLRFRQILINAVIATDIFDKDLIDARTIRWEKAFPHSQSVSDLSNNNDSKNEFGCNKSDLNATIVIEHIIQASDISHTMQHWQVYCKWNKKLFQEIYMAYLSGRIDIDPSTYWYKGELSFFENFVIPIAKKLKQCVVFGVSSDEYLDYACKYDVTFCYLPNIYFDVANFLFDFPCLTDDSEQ